MKANDLNLQNVKWNGENSHDQTVFFEELVFLVIHALNWMFLHVQNILISVICAEAF